MRYFNKNNNLNRFLKKKKNTSMECYKLKILVK